MASAIKLLGLCLCIVSLILEIEGFDAIQSAVNSENSAIYAAHRFKDATLKVTIAELLGWYIILIAGFIRPGGAISFLGCLSVLGAGVLSVGFTQMTCGYIQRSGVDANYDTLIIAARLNLIGLLALFAYALDRITKRIPGFD